MGCWNDHCRSLYFHVVTTTFGVPSVRVVPCMPRLPCTARPLTLRRVRLGCRSGLSRFGYLGQIPSVAYRGARSPSSFAFSPPSLPSSLRASCNLSHSLPRNTQPAAPLHAPRWWDRPLPLWDTKCSLIQLCHLRKFLVAPFRSRDTIRMVGLLSAGILLIQSSELNKTNQTGRNVEEEASPIQKYLADQ